MRPSIITLLLVSSFDLYCMDKRDVDAAKEILIHASKSLDIREENGESFGIVGDYDEYDRAFKKYDKKLLIEAVNNTSGKGTALYYLIKKSCGRMGCCLGWGAKSTVFKSRDESDHMF